MLPRDPADPLLFLNSCRRVNIRLTLRYHPYKIKFPVEDATVQLPQVPGRLHTTTVARTCSGLPRDRAPTLASKTHGTCTRCLIIAVPPLAPHPVNRFISGPNYRLGRQTLRILQIIQAAFRQKLRI